MNHRVSWLLFVLFLGIAACSAFPNTYTPTLIPTPISSPDNIATGVAEAKAIAATLTAEMPRMTISPSVTTAPEIRTTDTAIFEPSGSQTSTVSSMQIPKLTSTVLASVFGDVYGIEVITVEKVDSYYASPSGPVMPVDTIYPEQGNIFLKLGIKFYKDGVEIQDQIAIEERLELSVIDTNGEVYSIANEDSVIVEGYFNAINNTFTGTSLVVFFSVPFSSNGFKLQYRNLPLINLGL
jgi:hypothetical protein